MNPDTTLLDDLTAARSDVAGKLITALQARSRRLAKARGLAAAVIIIALIAGVLRDPPQEKHAVAVTSPSRSIMLTQNELLDSFGDQPVALVTWPDGRQQLLAITRRPAR